MSGTYPGFPTQTNSEFGMQGSPSPLATPAGQDVGLVSPLGGASEESAIQSLLSILNAGNTNSPTAGAPGPRGAPSTGNFMQDARGFGQAAGRTALGIAGNPTSLFTAVPATMAAAAIRGIAGLPNPQSLNAAFGVQGLVNAIRDSMSPNETSYTSGFGPSARSAVNTPALEAALTAGPRSAPQVVPAWDMQEAVGNKGFGADFDAGAISENTASGGADKDSTESNFAGGGIVELAGGGKLASGPGGGLDDLIPTTIDGGRAAALSDGEFVIPADVVSMMGDGSSNAGARRLYDLVRNVRDTKTGSTRQAGPLPVGEILKRSMR